MNYVYSHSGMLNLGLGLVTHRNSNSVRFVVFFVSYQTLFFDCVVIDVPMACLFPFILLRTSLYSIAIWKYWKNDGTMKGEDQIMYLDLSKQPLPPIYQRNGRGCYLDPIREKLIYITPEETIRQQVLSYLIHDRSVPQKMI